MESFQLIVENQDPSVSLIALIQRYTKRPLGEIRLNLITNKPVINEVIQHNSYDDFIEHTRSLILELEDTKESFSIKIDGEIESTEYMQNIFDQWFSIREELQESDDRVIYAHENN